MPTAAVNGVRLHYAIAGDGPPLLLIAGLGAHAGAWAGVLPLLAPRFRCISYDARGTGRSEVPPGPYPIEVLADDAAALIGRLGLAPVHAVGWSLGGVVLQSLLARHGGAIARAVLLSTFARYSALQHAWLDAVLALRRGGANRRDAAAFGLAWGLTPRLLADHTAAVARAEAAAADPFATGDAGFIAQAEGLRHHDARPTLPAIGRPTLVLTGAEDILSPVAQAIEMAALIPRAVLRILPRGGHRMIEEYPDDTLAAITGFLAAAGPGLG